MRGNAGANDRGMCGRFTYKLTWKQIHFLLNIHREMEAVELPPSFNVAPTQRVMVGREVRGGGREVVEMAWGLSPPWQACDAPGPINARCETVENNRIFRSAYESRRCVVPASGFYEWKKVAGGKQPMYITLLNREGFCFAGVWERREREGEGGVKVVQETFAILTTAANEVVKPIHDRMPVIVRPELMDSWLGKGKPDPAVFEPFPAEETTAWAVSSRVNSPRNNDERLIAEVKEDGGLWG